MGPDRHDPDRSDGARERRGGDRQGRRDQFGRPRQLRQAAGHGQSADGQASLILVKGRIAGPGASFMGGALGGLDRGAHRVGRVMSPAACWP